MDFEAELKALLAKAEAAGVHALIVAHQLAAQAAAAVKHEADIVRRHNPQLFEQATAGDQHPGVAQSDAKGG